MARGSKAADSLGNEPEHRVVLAVIYDKQGFPLREWPGFVIGRDKVGHGTSMAMGAVRFIDPESGELVRQWNPWGVLSAGKSERGSE